MAGQSVLYNFNLLHIIPWPSLFCRNFFGILNLAKLLCYSLLQWQEKYVMIRLFLWPFAPVSLESASSWHRIAALADAGLQT